MKRASGPELEQLDLLSAPYSDEGTSREAAQSLHGLPRLRALVLETIRAEGERGACNHELEGLLMLSGNTVRPRVWELRRLGLIEDSQQRRKTASGRWAVVWRTK